MPKKPLCNTPETVFPAGLDTPEFRKAWETWIQERKARFPRDVLTPRILASQLARCASAPGGHDHAVAMMTEAADRGWKIAKVEWVENPATAKAVATATQAAKPKTAWQIQDEIKELTTRRAQLWRSDFESQSGRDRYPREWAEVQALSPRIEALRSQLRAMT